MTPEKQTQKIVAALYRILGVHSLNEQTHNIPLYNLYSGVLIGLRIGITDVHAAKMVAQAVGSGQIDDISQMVVDEILEAVSDQE